VIQLCFNLNRIHDSVGKALRTAKQDRVIANSHELSFSFHPGLTFHMQKLDRKQAELSLACV
jgi:hypothetical protein